MPRIVRKTPIRTRTGRARPTMDAAIATETRDGGGRAVSRAAAPERARSRARRPTTRPARALSSRGTRIVGDEAERITERARDDHDRSRPRPGRERPSQDDEAGVARERKGDRKPTCGVDLRLERRRIAESHEDWIPEPFRQEEGGDRPDRDRRHDRDPKSADDRGQRDRELDAEEDLDASQAHAVGRLDHVLGCAS